MHPFRLLAIAAVFALATAACGGSESSDDTTPGSGPAAGSETTVEGDTDPPGSPVTGDGTPKEPITSGELGDSFRGVTAEEIKIGIIVVDVEAVGRDNGDVEAKWNAAIANVNDNGGVAGRNLVPVFAKYSPVVANATAAACTELTEDQQVFAAMGPLLTNTTCFTDTNETIFINNYGVSQEDFDRSKAVAIGPGALPSRSADLNVTELIDSGVLDGKVAVHAAADAGDERDLYVDALRDGGVEVVEPTQSTTGNDDPTATEAEMQAFAQVWESGGADSVLAIGAGSGLQVVAGVDRGNYRPQLVLTNSSDFDPALYRNLGYDTDALEGAVALGFDTFEVLAEANEAGVGECVSRFEEASGETVNIDPGDGEAINLNVTVWACQAIDIFAQVAEFAGPDLTNDSFRQAAESLGPLQVTAVAEASIGKDKFDIGDGGAVLLEYDADSDDFVAMS